MTIITLKDYAKQNNISYEAVRQQVARYKDELGTHIIKDGRQQFLDEEAVAFLDERRQKSPVAIIQMDKDEELEGLRRENKNLLIRVAELSDWKAENAVLIAEANNKQLQLEAQTQRAEETQRLLSASEQEKAQLREDSEKKAAEQQDEIERLREELEKEKARKLTFREWWKEKR